MPYINGQTTLQNYNAAKKQFNTPIPREHPENWPDGPWRWVEPEPVQLTPEQALSVKQSEIRMAANEAYDKPVTLQDGSIWNGGFDSAQAIKSAADLAEFAGLSTVSLYDSNNIEHVATLVQAKTVAAGIGLDYQVKFAAKQTAMRQLAEIDLTADDAVELIDAVEYGL